MSNSFEEGVAEVGPELEGLSFRSIHDITRRLRRPDPDVEDDEYVYGRLWCTTITSLAQLLNPIVTAKILSDI